MNENGNNTDINAKEQVTIVLSDDSKLQYRKIDLIDVSEYFASVFSCGKEYEESQTNVVTLKHFAETARIVQFVLDTLIFENKKLFKKFCQSIINYIEDEINSKTEENATSTEHDETISDWEHDFNSMLEVMDYLQIHGVNSADMDRVYEAIQIYKNPNHLSIECQQQGWITNDEPYTILAIPNNKKKKREWRYWVCYLLCLYNMPVPFEQYDAGDVVTFLQPYGDAISLRRELIEYKLIDREGDGSMYWRIPYTLTVIYNQLQVQDTRNYRRKII